MRSNLWEALRPASATENVESHEHTLRMKIVYVQTLYFDPSATLDDLREAVTTLEDMERIARRVFGVANPFTLEIAVELRQARANLRHREARQPAKNLAEEVD